MNCKKLIYRWSVVKEIQFDLQYICTVYCKILNAFIMKMSHKHLFVSSLLQMSEMSRVKLITLNVSYVNLLHILFFVVTLFSQKGSFTVFVLSCHPVLKLLIHAVWSSCINFSILFYSTASRASTQLKATVKCASLITYYLLLCFHNLYNSCNAGVAYYLVFILCSFRISGVWYPTWSEVPRTA